MTDRLSPDVEGPPPGADGTACRLVTRRRFIAALGASVATVVAAGYGVSVWGKDRRVAPVGIPASSAAVPPAGALGPLPDRTLLVIEMGGGNDGLNTVVPHASSRYRDLRGELAVDDPIDLDGEIGLHPALGFLAERYARGQVAIVEGVGTPDPDLSHFASMATWWSGLPDAPGTTGWLGRYLDGTIGPEDPLAGVAIGPGPSPALLGERSFQVSVQDLSGLAPRVPAWIDGPDDLMAMWRGFAPADAPGTALLDRVRLAIASTVDAAVELTDALGPPADGGDGDGAPDRRRARSDLATSMEVAAALVTGPNPPSVVYVHGWGDFDTHEGQAARRHALMETLDGALASFFAAVETAGVADRVVVMTTSEFGRRPAFNGSGTDHGTASSHFVLGPSIAGGRYGATPDLATLDRRGNPRHAVDFRSVYAAVLTGWLRADAATILSADIEALPLFG